VFRWVSTQAPLGGPDHVASTPPDARDTIAQNPPIVLPSVIFS